MDSPTDITASAPGPADAPAGAGDISAAIAVPKPKSEEDAAQVPESRRALVSTLTEWVRSERDFWKDAFDIVRDDEKFACGDQWGNIDEKNVLGLKKYSANIVQRQNALKVASLYAKNPTPVCKRRPKMDFLVWNGTQSQLQQAQQQMAAYAQQMQMTPPQPGQQPPAPPQQAVLILEDYKAGMANKKKYDKFGKTLEMLVNYELNEQQPDFFTQMWQLVLRTVTTNVGYVKVAYQRENESVPTASTTTTGFLEQLQALKAKVQELSEGDVDPADPAMEELKLMTLQLAQSAQMGEQKVTREGVLYDFPTVTSIIVDRKCRNLVGFIGADRIAQEFLMTPEKVLEKYDVDVRSGSARQYVNGEDKESGKQSSGILRTAVNWVKSKLTGWKDGSMACVWEIYDKNTQLKYVVCDGYPDFLEEPAAPDPEVTGFWPIGAYVKNPIEVEENKPKEFCTIYGQSDVRLMRSQQEELNRAREALRLHRIHNKDVYCYPEGSLNPAERDNISTAPSGAWIPIAALAAGQKLSDICQPLMHSPIDPAVYDNKHVMQDIMLTVGSQDADLGNAPAGQTATGQNIAATSRMSVSSSESDRLDKFLTWMIRTAGEMHLMETNGNTVRAKVGPGASWPIFDRNAIKNEIYLEVKAGSSGRPNKAVDVQNLTQALPWLQALWQQKGLDPTPLIQLGLDTLDADIDLDELIAQSQIQGAGWSQPGGPAAPGGPQQKGGPSDSESISIKLSDLAPTERAQALAMIGIKAASPDEVAAHMALQKPPKVVAPHAAGPATPPPAHRPLMQPTGKL